MSLTKRFIAILGTILLVFWGVSSLIAFSTVVEEMDEIAQEDLSMTATRLMPLVIREVGRSNATRADAEEEDEGDGHEMHEMEEEGRFLFASSDGAMAFIVRDDDGQVLLQSYDSLDQEFPDRAIPGMTTTDHLILYTIHDEETGIWLQVARPDAHRTEAIREAAAALFIPLILLIPLLILSVIFTVRKGLKPVEVLREQVAARSGNNLEPINVSEQPPELRPIALAVDRLLERLRLAMEAERDFAASSAHELRTPVAGALAQAQRLSEELESGPGRERAAQIEATLHRLAEFTEKLLQLSRAEAGIGAGLHREDMGPVLKLVRAEFTERANAPAQVSVEDNLHQPLNVAMDPDAFAIALRNLIENAIKHGTDGNVRVTIQPDWSIHVFNNGPTLDAETLAGLQKRFVRGPTQASGSGLGLAIVDRIMRQAGGGLDLISPATGQNDGFEAILRLP